LITHSRLEIYLDLLLAVSQTPDLATIADKVKLSPSAVKDHLAFLTSQGFVANQIMDDRTIKYEPTAKGFEVLMAFHKLTKHKDPILEEKLSA
jgi:predicted ArsR family transcriptional regulator